MNNNGGSSATVSVAVTPGSATVNTGATQQFSVTINGTSDKRAGWDVDGIKGGNAGVGQLFEFAVGNRQGAALLFEGRVVHSAIL